MLTSSGPSQQSLVQPCNAGDSESGSASGSASGSEIVSSTSEFEPGLNNFPTPAQAGFNAGDGKRFFTLPGSGFSEILNLTSSSNVGRPGVWVFRVDGVEVIAGGIYSVN